MFFIAYAFKGLGPVCRTGENCKSPDLQDTCNIEIFLSPAVLLNTLVHMCFGTQKNPLSEMFLLGTHTICTS